MGFFLTFLCCVLAGAFLYGVVWWLMVAARRYSRPFPNIHRRLVAMYERELADPELAPKVTCALLLMWLILPGSLAIAVGFVSFVANDLLALPHHTPMMYLGLLAGGVMIGVNLVQMLFVIHLRREAGRRATVQPLM